MDPYVSHLCRTCYFHLRAIGHIRKYITKECATILVQSLIHSRLDYCNSLLVDITSEQMTRLQKIQNTAARIVSLSSRTSHITPVLISLHWLPVKARIEFKLLSFVYKCLHGLAPVYLIELLTPYIPERTLRSKDHKLLTVPTRHLKTFGKRAFDYVAPVMWNSLPLGLKLSPDFNTFKSMLKTHLFRKYYETSL